MSDTVAPTGGWFVPPTLEANGNNGHLGRFEPEQNRFGPNSPILPSSPEIRPRLYEYPAGVNVVYLPRQGYGLYPFETLRTIADYCKEVRLNVELIKRQLRALDFTLIPVDESHRKDYSQQIKIAEKFWQSPDDMSGDFDAWLSMVLEDLLVLDASAIWPTKTKDGTLIGVEVVAGDTIAPMIDFRGRVPKAGVAYLQVLHGMPTSWYSRRALIYRAMNPRTYAPYGRSPIENFLAVINLSLNRDMYQASYFTSGNIPEAIIGAPAEWTPEQIQTFQNAFDQLLTGNFAQQRKLHLFPMGAGSSSLPVFEFKKDIMEDNGTNEWLMKVACWAFGNNPSEFGITGGDGLGGAGYTASMENAQYRSMYGPMTAFLSGVFTMITQQFLGYPMLKWQWVGMEPKEDEMVTAQVHQIYVQLGVYGVDHVARELGVPVPKKSESAEQTDEAGGDSFFKIRKMSSGIGKDDPLHSMKAKDALALRQILVEYFSGLQARILDALKVQAEGEAGQTNPMTENFIAKEEGILRRLLLPFFARLSVQSVGLANAELDDIGLNVGADIMQAHDKASEWAAAHTDEIIAQLLKRDANGLVGIGRHVANWINMPGATIGQLKEVLTPILGGNESRAQSFAVTEVTRAYASGDDIVYSLAGVEPAAFNPPAHPRCRCWKRPVRVNGKWEQVWATNNDEVVCSTPINTPWGVRSGCGAMHNTFLTGEKAGEKYNS